MLSPHFVRSVHRYWAPTATAFFVNGTAFGGWAAQIAHATARMQLSEGTFGLMLLGMGIGAVLGMVISRRLIARHGAGPIIRATFLLFLAIYVVLSTTANVPVFVIALLLFGGSGGLMDVAMNAYAADVERQMSWRVMASFHGMWSIGGLIGAALVSYMLSVFSGLTQALALAAALLALFMLWQHHLKPLQHHLEGRIEQRATLDRVTVILGILAIICFAAEGAVRDWSGLYLTKELHAAIDRAGWGYAALSATMALCRFTGDWMRVRFGESKVLAVSGMVAIAGFVLAVLTDHDLLAVAGFGLTGLGLANTVPILISAAGRTETPSSSIAFLVSFGYAGHLGGPPVLGFLAAHTSLATMFLIVAASCLAIIVGWAFLPAEKR
ncbi:MAG TPA: MFS transporter [Dongiaceae bacterium]|nr:MFS transporter [Dongiaceae bacterium]